jgi:hypothetical protein
MAKTAAEQLIDLVYADGAPEYDEDLYNDEHGVPTEPFPIPDEEGDE